MSEPTQIAASSLNLDSEDLPQLLDDEENASQALSKAKALWFFGDWPSLAGISRKEIETHPARGRLALLVASANCQTGDDQKARELVRAALDWDCPPRLIAQVLAAGVHNSLGRAAALQKDEQRLKHHFSAAVATVAGQDQAQLVSQSRAVSEMSRLGLLPDAAKVLDAQIGSMKDSARVDRARISIIESELELLKHELSLAQQRGQVQGETSPNEIHSEIGPPNQSADWLKRLSVSQLGQDLWVLEQTGYKREGFFVEFGATDGILLSNTWLLEKEFGWKGICIEPNPNLFSQLKKNRSCQVSNAYIGGSSGKPVEFILADAYGTSSEYAGKDQHAEKREAYRQAGFTTNLISVSLDELLEQQEAPSQIDYISIDTEGSEYEILSTFPFYKWGVRIFTVEHNFTDQRHKIRDLMEKNGYSWHEAEWDDWYVKDGES